VGQPFRIGRVIGRSFALWARNLPLLFALVLVVHLPWVAYDTYRILSPSRAEPHEPLPENVGLAEVLAYLRPYVLHSVGGQLGYAIFERLAEAVVIFAVYRRLRGDAPSFRASLRGGLRRLWPVASVALVLFAIDFALGVGFVVLLFLWAIRFGPTMQLLMLAFVGYPVLRAAVFLPLWVAIPAAVVDRGRNALGRSWSLTRGRRLKVFVLLLLVVAIDWTTSRFLAPLLRDLPLWASWASQAIRWVRGLLLASLGAVLAVVGYQALRLEKEGVDVTRLEEIFG